MINFCIALIFHMKSENIFKSGNIDLDFLWTPCINTNKLDLIDQKMHFNVEYVFGFMYMV